jgi:phenylalanyl-tRNA synthetase alpha chain
MTEDAKKFLAEVTALKTGAEKAATAVSDGKALERWRIEFLGRKSPLGRLSKSLTSLSEDDRPAAGKALNELRADLKAEYESLQNRLGPKKAGADEARLDYTLPGVQPPIGTLHPLTKTYYEITAFFASLGFNVAHGPEVEDEFHNFGALNFPPDHPSRDAQDTLYVNDEWLLRTHTSPVQIRVMLEQQPPLRVIVPGRCFRADAVDASHYPVFHQVEGLLVDENVSLGDLKGTLAAFAEYIFGADTKMRFRPHFFPFTEPSAEVTPTSSATSPTTPNNGPATRSAWASNASPCSSTASTISGSSTKTTSRS